MTNPKFDYKGWTIEDAMDALSAYDGGYTDSGVRDPLMKKAVKDYLQALDPSSFRYLISSFVGDQFLTEEALKLGYGIEDVMVFVRWLNDELGIYYTRD